MAISDTQKVDYLFKKLGYGVSKTDTTSNKEAFNESLASPLLIRGDTVWTNAGSIPSVKPTLSNSNITIYDDSGPTSPTVECTEDITATDNRTWKTNSADWVPTEFGSTYQIKVYIDSTSASAPQTTGTQIFAAGSGNNDEWFFDYQSGVLHFIGTNLPTSIASGVTGKSIYVVGARYTGDKGVTGASDLVFTNTTITTSTSNANIVLDPNGTGNVTIDTNTGLVIPLGTTGQRPGTPNTAMMRFNSSISKIEVYNGSTWETVGVNLASIATQSITGDGSTTVFTLDETTTAPSIILSINGVLQVPNLGYTVSGTALTMSEAPTVTDIIEIRFISNITTVTEVTDPTGNTSFSVDSTTASIIVDSTTIAQITTDDIFNISTAHSLKLPVYTTAEANALSDKAVGQVVYISNGDGGNPCLSFYNGSSWIYISSSENIQDVIGAMVSGNTETGISVTYQDSDGTLDFSLTEDPVITLSGDVTGSATMTNLSNVTISTVVGNDSHTHAYSNLTSVPSTFTPTTENVQDIVGAMVSGNTETGISVTYQDSDGTLDFSLTSDPTITLAGAVTGSATMTDLGNVTITTTATSDPTITLQGAVTGSATMTDLGNVTLNTTATSDPTLTLSGDATGSATFTDLGNATLSVTIVDSSHNHTIATVEGLQSALDLKATIASPTLTGTPLAPTAASNTNTTQIATTAYVQTEITDLIDGAPGTLDTLNELAAAINDDASYASTLTTALGTKVAKSGDTMTGLLILNADPIVDLGASTKQYVDAVSTASTSALALKVAKSGDTMTGKLTLSADPTNALHAATKQYVDTATSGGNINLGTDTTGNYVASGATFGSGISGSVASEGGTFTVSSNATSANTASTIVFRDASGNFSGGTFTGLSTTAQYADLAENYTSDSDYLPGTVVILGGNAEVTECNEYCSRKVAGVVSTNPAYLMNNNLSEMHVAVALTGRVRCNVTGTVEKGDLIVSSSEKGYAEAWKDTETDPRAGTILGKSLESKTSDIKGSIEVIIGLK